MDVDSVAQELFGLPMDEFTTVRNKRSKQARADGDRDLAQQIQRLRKPTTSAWLVNQLARHHADELEPLLALGRDLRAAGGSLGGDELRALTRQRHQVVHALVQVTRRRGREHGIKVSNAVADEVRGTLEASLADPDAATAVLAGRLTQPLQQVGFGVFAPDDRQPRAESTSRSEAAVTDLDSHRRERAGRAREQAEQALQQAEQALEQAQSSFRLAQHEQHAATEARRAADAEVERLRAELTGAEQEADAAAEQEQSSQDRAGDAEREVRDARSERERAAADLDALGT